VRALTLTGSALTETYSPTAIDIEPATRPATPAIKMACFDAEAAATPLSVVAFASLDTVECVKRYFKTQGPPARDEYFRRDQAISLGNCTAKPGSASPHRSG
jgi:hypothetical protein